MAEICRLKKLNTETLNRRVQKPILVNKFMASLNMLGQISIKEKGEQSSKLQLICEQACVLLKGQIPTQRADYCTDKYRSSNLASNYDM